METGTQIPRIGIDRLGRRPAAAPMRSRLEDLDKRSTAFTTGTNLPQPRRIPDSTIPVYTFPYEKPSSNALILPHRNIFSKASISAYQSHRRGCPWCARPFPYAELPDDEALFSCRQRSGRCQSTPPQSEVEILECDCSPWDCVSQPLAHKAHQNWHHDRSQRSPCRLRRSSIPHKRAMSQIRRRK